MCFRTDEYWHCHQEHGGCKGKLDKLTDDEPIPSKWVPCKKAEQTGNLCDEVMVIPQHLAMCCLMHHSRRMRQLEELWKDEWKNQVFDHFVQKRKHLSDREKTGLRRARDLEKNRWTEFQARLEPLYTQLGNQLNSAVVRTHGRNFYERIEQIMVNFVDQVRQKCVLEPEIQERNRQADAAAAAAGPPPPIPPKSSKRRQRSLTSVKEGDLQKAQDALRQMSLSGAAGGSAPAQTRPLPPAPTPAQAGYTVSRAPVAAAVAGPSSSSPSFGPDDDAAIAAAASIEHAFRPPSRGSSAASSSDEDSESEDEKPLLSRDL
ncbi:hypothetical protein QBC32DRAFT_225015 [Pseudoneurospora amorphoporcata]|uniref:Uncharacterized protein n=1 Tax=Pseudoneurospora amorphoporcata TaxID=241081 RepID=A0AAN6NJL8_9PEZI|nr:hypothetical protein QBC32DRAFT_225015 [Pseudoneurospora amorphoporcata]